MANRKSSKREKLGSKERKRSSPRSSSSETLSGTIEFTQETFVLEGVDYFHPYTTREFCDEILTEEGDFLIRRSKHQSEYVLSVRNNNEIQHIKANLKENQMYFCMKDVAFSSMSELMAAHFNNKYPIVKGQPNNVYIVRPVPIPHWIFDPNKVDIQHFISRGNTCDVWSGTLTTENGQEQIALKIPRSDDTEQSFALLRESRILRTLKHPNLVSWRGIVNKDEETMLVTEFIKHGTLSQLFKRLTLRGKVKGCLDVAKGLHYLHTNQLIHRNIAARNCLCDFEENGAMIVKISDLYLCRGNGTDVTNLDTVHVIPPAWTAPESLINNEWSSASDVWSYGVMLWETFSGGQTPYKNVLKKVDVESVTYYLLRLNKRLDPPKDMPSEVADVMNSCFQEKPESRPRMNEVIEKIQAIHESMKK